MIAATLATALASAAYGFDFSPAGDLPEPAEEGTRVDVFLGLSLGSDSNPGRATSGNEESDAVLEALAGIAFSRGNTRLDYHLSAEARVERYSELDRFDFEESILKGDMSWATRKFRFGLTGRCAVLADPTEVETLDFDVLERTESSYAPEVGFTFGKIVLGLSYHFKKFDYEDSSVDDLDHEDASTGLELRFGRPEKRQYFLHFDSGAVDYRESWSPRRDYDYTKLYAGWRSRMPRTSSFEVGAGLNRVESDDFGSEDETYATVRTTRMLQGGSAALEAGYTRSVEPAATADYKTASRVLLRYSKKVNMRRRWSLGYRLESSEFTNPDATTADSLSVHVADFGFEHTLGSPEGRHGRLYAALSYESGNDFERLRIFAGIALAY